MPAAKEKNSFQLVARFMALLLLLAATAASAQARSAAENRVWEKSAPVAESLLFQPLQLLELHQVKAPVRWYDASGYTFEMDISVTKVVKGVEKDLFGNYDPIGNRVELYRGSNLGTRLHELLHARYFRAMSDAEWDEWLASPERFRLSMEALVDRFLARYFKG